MTNVKPRDEGERIELDLPSEGFSTLAAQFTGDMMARVTDTVTRMKNSGMPEGKIIERLRQQLRHLDDRSLKLVYNKALGGTTDETFKPTEIKSAKDVKPGTIEIELAVDRKDISIGSVIQYKKDIYTIARLTRTGYVIKMVK